MRVKILRDLQTRSGRVFREGREHDLSDGEARVLIRRGVAKIIRTKSRRPTSVEAGAADSRGG